MNQLCFSRHSRRHATMIDHSTHGELDSDNSISLQMYKNMKSIKVSIFHRQGNMLISKREVGKPSEK